MNDNFKNEYAASISDPKMCGKAMYKCGICGTVHDTIAARAKCEMACLEKQEEERKLAAEKKKREEKAARKKEVDDAIKNVNNLIDRYTEDYGSYYTTEPIKYSHMFTDSFRDLINMLP